MSRPRRLVYDTNVIISAVLTPEGFCDQLIRNVAAGDVSLFVSPAILDEYERILTRESVTRIHQLTPPEITILVKSIEGHSTIVEPPEVPKIIANDPSDDIFLAAAVTGAAEFIVSGDRHLLELQCYRGIEILRPHEMLHFLSIDSTI